METNEPFYVQKLRDDHARPQTKSPGYSMRAFGRDIGHHTDLLNSGVITINRLCKYGAARCTTFGTISFFLQAHKKFLLACGLILTSFCPSGHATSLSFDNKEEEETRCEKPRENALTAFRLIEKPDGSSLAEYLLKYPFAKFARNEHCQNMYLSAIVNRNNKSRKELESIR